MTMATAHVSHSLVLADARALSKLRWRCRRGLLENDLFIERFFQRFSDT
jgi:antitoxin CptB